MNKKNVFINIVTGFFGQFIVLVLGIAVPRFFIKSYGSDVNGLLSTITQIFTYLALLEAGIGSASQNALYKSVKDNDQDEIVKIASETRRYFGKFTIYYAIGVIVLAVCAPFLLKTEVDKMTVFVVILFEGLAGVVSFYYIQTPTILLSVSGRSYVNNAIVLLNKVIAYIVKILMAYLGLSIVLLQIVFFAISIIKVVIYGVYMRKNYPWLVYNKNANYGLLRDRNAYVLTEIAWTIFSSTDMIVLSLFVSTKLSSVYAIYNMVFTSINVLMNAVYNSVRYVLGYSYHEGIKEYELIHDAFSSIFLGIMTVLMSVCYILTIPFVKLYTNGVADINYVYSGLPLMFCLIQIFSWSRYIGGNLTGIAGYAKQTSYVSLIEAITNLMLSILFVFKFGIIGVTFATVIALPLKVVWCVYVSDKKVIKRPYTKSILIIGVNLLFFSAVVLTTKFYIPIINNYRDFLLWGCVLTFLLGLIGMIVNVIANQSCLRIAKKYIVK